MRKRDSKFTLPGAVIIRRRTYTSYGDISTRSAKWAEQQLLGNALPFGFDDRKVLVVKNISDRTRSQTACGILEAFAKTRVLPLTSGPYVTFRRPVPFIREPVRKWWQIWK